MSTLSTDLINLIDSISAVSGKKEKQEIIANIPDAILPSFLSLCRITMSTDCVYNIRKLPKYINAYDGFTSFEREGYELLERLHYRMVTGSAAINECKTFLTKASPSCAKLFEIVIDGKLNCGASASTINKVYPGTIYSHPYHGCVTPTKERLAKIKCPVITQTKEDGMYVDIYVKVNKNSTKTLVGAPYESSESENVVFARARSGIEKKIISQTLADDLTERLKGMSDDEFGAFIVLSGEMLVIDPSTSEIMNRADGNTYIERSDFDIDNLIFRFWDIIPHAIHSGSSKEKSKPYEERLEALTHFLCGVSEPNKKLDLVETRVCKTVEEIKEHYHTNRVRGAEGIVVKAFGSVWCDGKNPQQIKLKTIAECEMKVTGILEGKGALAGSTGSLECESSDEKVIVNVGGIAHDLRKKWFLKPELIVSKIVTTRFNDLTSNKTTGKYSLYLPRFVEIRNDKTVADDIDTIRQCLTVTDSIIDWFGAGDD